VTEAVLDASALLAFLQNEPGADKVEAVLTRSCISSVNLAETLSKLVHYGKPLDAVTYHIERLRLPVIPFDAADAKIVASLWLSTRASGLSLGDRACLALGLRLAVPVLTAERAWANLKIGVNVGIIR
jgi:PIN domain nuclease of toxin-antitoxin system